MDQWKKGLDRQFEEGQHEQLFGEKSESLCIAINFNFFNLKPVLVILEPNSLYTRSAPRLNTVTLPSLP